MHSKRLTNADFIYGLVTLLFCALWIYLALDFPHGTQDGVPGPGVFPILVSCVLAGMAIFLMIRSFINPTCFFGFGLFEKQNKIALISTFLAFIVYLFIWWHIEYITATIFLTMALGLVYRVALKTLIPLSLVFSFGTHYVFGKFLLIILELH